MFYEFLEMTGAKKLPSIETEFFALINRKNDWLELEVWIWPGLFIVIHDGSVNFDCMSENPYW